MANEAPAAAAPEITVSIVSYNTRELLRACLRALTARQEAGEARLQIVVADNDSQDGSVAMVRSEFPGVEVIETGGNIGYGRANNLAFERARAPYFFVLNSDTEVQPGALAALRDFLETHAEAGGVGAQLVYPDGRPQASYGSDPELLGILLEQTYLYKILPRASVTDGSSHVAPETEVREVPQICGACQFFRTQAYRQVAGFDPAYFMYHEDVDLNIRVRRAGWKLFFVPQARIVHHLGASSSTDWQKRARMVSALNESRYYYFSRYGGPGQALLLKAMFLLGAGLRLVGWSCLSLLRPAWRDKVRLFRVVVRRTLAMRPYRPA